ncbi:MULTISPECIES: hypothetical protein [Streptomyces]|uniref:Uncharacterized protein n=1 Tax=Streptomyces griseiscabiei TaxID=2993540 RepID=A0ABU4L3S8_9ACTN|nr:MULTISPECIES: hypothetical protein [Streptomyces]MBZ3905292.1 hypothetical protein [Streptomyces griseiscabiei]MDX2910378.1 hypothetical protein [Streptomyces griseiscabiei]
MSPFLSSPNGSAGRAPAGAGPVRPAEDRPATVAENSALGHVLRRLAREAVHPEVSYLAEFESSLPCEAEASMG